MAFNYQNAGAFGVKSTPTNNGNNSQAQAQNGSDLEDIQTEAIGFQAISGDAKVQLLSTPWPSDNLPLPTSSLLSIASRRGLLAAAGPDGVILALTENVRKAFEAPSANGNLKPLESQLQLPMPFRISQVVFSADEEFLILSAETGGGLAIYEVQALLNGHKDSAFQIPTNNEAIRALVPNPVAEKGEFIAVVTSEGKLMIADLKQKNFISGADGGPVLKEQVSCVSWSKLGKQLVAGLANGTSYQLTPQGVGKAEIPKPPSLSGDFFVSQVLWLETFVFLTVYTPTNFDNGQAPNSEFYIITTAKEAPYTFQKVSEPVGPFGLNRSPPHQFILRLKDFPPNLQDALIVASSASGDLGLLTRSAAPLEQSKKIINVFTNTEPADDARRAALPIGADGVSDTSPIGMALDLSAKESVYRPIPLDDEIDRSDGPLPGVMVLTNEGVLTSWWVVYSDSIRHKTTYPGLVSQQAAQPPPAQQQQQSAFAPTTTQSAFGAAPSFGGAAPAFGAGSGMGPRASPWGTTPGSNNSSGTSTPVGSFGASTFGKSTFGTSAFGTPSLPSALVAPAKPFGSTTSPAQGSAPAFGKPAFGQPAFGQPAAFGSPALPNSKPSPWGTPSTATSSTAPATSSVPAAGGFASFAKGGGFGAASSAGTSSGNLFGPKQSSGGFSAFSGGSSTFGQPEEKPKNVFGSMDTPTEMTDTSNAQDKPMLQGNSIFGNPNKSAATASTPEQNGNNPFAQNKLGGLFGNGPINATGNKSEKPNPFSKDQSGSSFSPGAFKLQSSFKPDSSAEDDKDDKDDKDDLPRPSSGSGISMFGSGFSAALGGSQTPVSKDQPSDGKSESTPPSATPMPFGLGSENAASKTGGSTGSGNIFGSKASEPAQSSTSNTGLFGNLQKTSTPSTSIFGGLKNEPNTTSGSLFGDPKNKLSSTTGSLFGGSKVEPSTSTGSLFGGSTRESSEPSLSATQSIFGGSKPSEATKANGSPFRSFGTLAKSKSPEPETTNPAVPHDGGKLKANIPESDAPLPPDFSSLPKPPAAEPPSPPDFLPQDILPPMPAEDSDSEAPETGDETYSLQTDDEGDDEGGGFSEEGSGEDVAKDLSPVSDSNQTMGHTPQSSFGDRNVAKGPSSLFPNIEKSGQSSSTRPLFGEVPNFPPPARPGSPRSPSPTRRSAVPGRMRPDPSRSVSTPPTGPSSSPSFFKSQPAPSRPATSAASATAARLSVEQKIADDAKKARAKAEKEAKEAEEAQAMIDHEDDLAQRQLAAEIVPTTILDEFIAHQDYIGSADRTGIPAQVETVYRDINSMVDTLGMNARALKAFILGHTKEQKAGGRTKEDLEMDNDDWVLVELENLTSIIEQDLTHELENNRIRDAPSKLRECSDLKDQVAKLRQKHEDVKQLVADKADPIKREAALAAPLSKDQAQKQFEVRQEFRKFHEQLIEAEEGLTMLKTKLVSRGGKASVGGNGVPTIEAVMRTISKMTAMAEKKSGDVDVLENEIRNMNLGASRGSVSMEESPFAASIRSSPLGQSTPRASVAMRTPLRSSMAKSYNSARFSGMHQTPDSFRSSPTANRGFGMSASVLSRSRGSLGSSMRSSILGSPAKLTMDKVPDEAVQRVSAKMARKKALAEQLRTAMARVAPRVMDMDD